jgi:hypothetical protein
MESAKVLLFFEEDCILYTNMEISLFHFAFGLKKAGFFGGTFSESEKLGTKSSVFPSLVLETSYFDPRM